MTSRWNNALLLVVASALAAQGCAGVGLTLFGVTTGVTAGTGVSYTLDSVAYKTFTAPMEDLQRATLATLGRMDVVVKDRQTTESGTTIAATAGDRDIDIELDRLTAKASRMRVNARQGWFFKDRATATEIIVQTERTLEDEPVRSEASKHQ